MHPADVFSDKMTKTAQNQEPLEEKSSPKTLVLGGKRGLLGQALAHVFSGNGWKVSVHAREHLDIFNPEELERYIQKIGPDYIFNTIAYTKVDQAEAEPEKAFKLNKKFLQILAKTIKDKDVYLINFSTDFIFDGDKQSPYTPEDIPAPLSVYGQSKLAGEKVLLESGLDRLLIIRTSWLFGPWKTNFVNNILSQSKNCSEINVVHDQVGSPTYTLDVASYTYKLLQQEPTGIYHVCNSGEASWCELAAEIMDICGAKEKVKPITSDQYPQAAKRPRYSVLDTSKMSAILQEKPRSWLQALRYYMYCFHSNLISETD